MSSPSDLIIVIAFRDLNVQTVSRRNADDDASTVHFIRQFRYIGLYERRQMLLFINLRILYVVRRCAQHTASHCQRRRSSTNIIELRNDTMIP